MMHKYIFSFLLFSGCQAVALIDQSTDAIHANRQAVEASTCAIWKNTQVVNESTHALEENQRLLESSE